MKIVLAAAAGFALGYVFSKIQLEQVYANEAMQEIDDAKEHYASKYEQMVADLEKLGEDDQKSEKSVVEDRQEDYGQDVVEIPPMVVKAMTSYQTGMAVDVVPYVISADAFLAGELDYSQPSYTYYEGDKKLVDENDQLVLEGDIASTVGAENLEKFGEESDDPNSVYVRNDMLRVDYEIVRSHGHYAVEVLGLDTVTGDHA